jgi:hypothetical protein
VIVPELRLELLDVVEGGWCERCRRASVVTLHVVPVAGGEPRGVSSSAVCEACDWCAVCGGWCEH